ncbi:MAG: hypothetical protein JWP34_4855 [Massilia sp.]|nr:hypothetical protein [Massilia sp.]
MTTLAYEMQFRDLLFVEADMRRGDLEARQMGKTVVYVLSGGGQVEEAELVYAIYLVMYNRFDYGKLSCPTTSP